MQAESELRSRLNGVELPWLLEYLDERLQAIPDEQLVDLIRPLFDRRRVEPIVEYVGERLRLGEGERRVTFEFSSDPQRPGAHLRRTRLAHEPIGNVELEELARV